LIKPDETGYFPKCVKIRNMEKQIRNYWWRENKNANGQTIAINRKKLFSGVKDYTLIEKNMLEMRDKENNELY